MRFTIERLRMMLLATAGLLLAALVVFLVIGRWRQSASHHDMPKRLGLDIKQEASGWTYTHGVGRHTLFKIHASRLIQMKQGNHVLLHDVRIELYGADGKSLDSIEGNEFEYDPEGGIAKANGPVEITLTRPGVAPAIAPHATPEKMLGEKSRSTPLKQAARKAAGGEVHVETSGLVFDRNSGVASTDQKVEFSLEQGSGSAVGARYDSSMSTLELGRAVRLRIQRGDVPVELQAAHAEFANGNRVCRLNDAVASYQDGQARATEAMVQFGADGAAQKLTATNGFTLTTEAGKSLSAPTGSLLFDAHNQPKTGHLEGGVTFEAQDGGKQVHGTAPSMDVAFAGHGVLRSAHLERGVVITSHETSGPPGAVEHTQRTWRSPLADVDFRSVGHGSVELASIEGTGGVVVTGESRDGKGQVTTSRMSADAVKGAFGAKSVLTAMTGTGHASMEQTTRTGARQTTSGDRVTVHFAGAKTAHRSGSRTESTQIASATVEGHVVFVQQPGAHAGASQLLMRATADRAAYEGAGEWLHLMGNPRVEDGPLQLSAGRIDVSQASGDAVARGDVKATWLDPGRGAVQRTDASKGGSTMLGGQGPAHAVAAEAELNQATGEAIFRGEARLWQQGNSISAPKIVLDRNRQTLVAETTRAADPVRVVLVNTTMPIALKKGQLAAPSVVRMRGSHLKYSAAERKATMRGGVAGAVVAQTEDGTTRAKEVELVLLPPGNHAGPGGRPAQVDRMTARGQVSIALEGRRATGQKLVYTNDSGEYVMTGTAAAPPQLIDPTRGTVSGEALIFNSRDDSVRIEGGAGKTVTETIAPR